MPPSSLRPNATRGGPVDGGGAASTTDRLRAPLTAARVVAAAVLAVLLVGSVALFEFLGVPSAVGGAGAPGGSGPARTSDPTVATPAKPLPHFSGAILFVRDGDIWSATSAGFTELSRKGTDEFPVWAADGRRVFFTETDRQLAKAPSAGQFSNITLEYPTLMSMAADGSDRKSILSSLIRLPGPPDAKFFFQIIEPDLSPDGTQLALVSDAADPLGADVTLSVVPVGGGKVRTLPVRDNRGFGHNDPSWSPDGKSIAFSYNGGAGGIGTPRIGVYDLANRTLRFVGGTGYANPDWSPDGRHLVVERTNGKGRDLVVLDAASGTVVNRLTTDGQSFAPTFSPDGSQIAFLHLDGQAIDVRLLSLSPDGGFTVTSNQPVTADGHIDGRSPLSWSSAAGAGAGTAP